MADLSSGVWKTTSCALPGMRSEAYAPPVSPGADDPDEAPVPPFHRFHAFHALMR